MKEVTTTLERTVRETLTKTETITTTTTLAPGAPHTTTVTKTETVTVTTPRITEPGTVDPVADIGDIEEESVLWYLRLLQNNFDKISRSIKGGEALESAIREVFSGIGVKEHHVKIALQESKLICKDFENWSDEKSKEFCWVLKDVSMPTLIVANKMDLKTAPENFKRIQEAYPE